jgi:hypothetical protein
MIALGTVFRRVRSVLQGGREDWRGRRITGAGSPHSGQRTAVTLMPRRPCLRTVSQGEAALVLRGPLQRVLSGPFHE